MIIRGVSIKKTIVLSSSGKISEIKPFSLIEDILQEKITEAFNKGQTQGLFIGSEKIHKNLEHSLHLLRKISSVFIDKTSQILESIKPELINFSLKVCEKILQYELKNPLILKEVICNLINRIISEISSESITVSLCSEDLEHIKTLYSSLPGNSNPTPIKWKQDVFMKQGNCKIETSLGLINFDIEQELSALKMVLAS